MHNAFYAIKHSETHQKSMKMWPAIKIEKIYRKPRDCSKVGIIRQRLSYLIKILTDPREMWTTCTKTENFSLELQAKRGARNVKYSSRKFD